MSKNIKRVIMYGILFILIASIGLGGCSYINARLGLKNDNEMEQAIEWVIEGQLKLPPGSLDLTPED